MKTIEIIIPYFTIYFIFQVGIATFIRMFKTENVVILRRKDYIRCLIPLFGIGYGLYKIFQSAFQKD